MADPVLKHGEFEAVEVSSGQFAVVDSSGKEITGNVNNLFDACSMAWLIFGGNTPKAAYDHIIRLQNRRAAKRKPRRWGGTRNGA